MPNLITVFHGSLHKFEKINVTKGNECKHFGKGFYVTSEYQHAINLVRRNYAKEKARIAGNNDTRIRMYIYHYSLDTNALPGLSIKKFDCADMDWLLFLIQNRQASHTLHDFDVIIGPDTRTSLRSVMEMAEGKILDDFLLKQLLNFLGTESLPQQICFATQRAADLLIFLKKEKLT